MANEDKTNKRKEPSVNDGIFNAQDTAEFFSNIGNNKESGNSRDASLDSGDKGNSNGKPSVDDQIAELKKEISTVGKRYGDSSNEAIKLKQQLDELQPFMPIFDEMKQNPNLISTMRSEIESQRQPKSAKEALGLSDDFVFNAEEATTDINSDSAKVLRYMGRVEADESARRIAKETAKVRASDKQASDFNSFVTNTKLDKNQTDNLKTYMREHELTLNDVYYLMNRENVAKDIATRARAETLKQIEGSRNMNGDSLGTRESMIRNTKDDDAFFDNVFGKREEGIFN